MRWPPARCRPGALALAAALACASGPSRGQVTADGAAPAAPAEAAAPADGPIAGNGLQLPGNPQERPAKRWRLPPITWSGSLAYDLRLDKGEGEPRITDQLTTLRLGASSYIYQPWLATIGVHGGLTYDHLHVGGGESRTNRDTFSSGGFQLNVFPRSRFPFTLFAEANDSRLNLSDANTQSYRTREWGVEQRYRPPVGRWDLLGSYRHRSQSGANLGDATQQTANVNFNSSWKNHALHFGAIDARTDTTSTNESGHFQSAFGRHAFNPGPAFSLNNSANWTRNRNEIVSGDTDLAVSQWTSVALMRPDDAWTVSANARLLRFDDRGGSAEPVDTVGAGLGASWEVNRNARLSANSSATVVDSGVARTKSLIGTLGANWQGDSINLPDDWRYDWFSSGNLSAARSTGRSDRSATLQIGHSLARGVAIGDDQMLNLSVGQTLSLHRSWGDTHAVSSSTDTTRLDTHSAAVSWSNSRDGSSHYARLGFNDSREIGGGRSHFQLLTGQVSGNWELDRDQNFHADLSGQRMRQKSGTDTSDLASGTDQPGERLGNDSIAGEASYRHRRFLGVPRLAFTARVRLARDMQSDTGPLSNIPDRETRLAEARTDYQIGRLESSVIVRMSQVDGRWRQLLLWHLQRNFSGGP